MLRLRESLLLAEEGRARGEVGYSIDEASQMMEDAIREVSDAKR